jgi:hypothetical protein
MSVAAIASSVGRPDVRAINRGMVIIAVSVNALMHSKLNCRLIAGDVRNVARPLASSTHAALAALVGAALFAARAS